MLNQQKFLSNKSLISSIVLSSFLFYKLSFAAPTGEAISPTDEDLDIKVDTKNPCYTDNFRKKMIASIYTLIDAFEMENPLVPVNSSILEDIMAKDVKYFGYAYTANGLKQLVNYSSNIKKKLKNNYTYNLYTNIQNLHIRPMPIFLSFSDDMYDGKCRANWSVKLISQSKKENFPILGEYNYNAIFNKDFKISLLKVTEISKDYICPTSKYTKDTKDKDNKCVRL
jgi:hypothetical protein